MPDSSLGLLGKVIRDDGQEFSDGISFFKYPDHSHLVQIKIAFNVPMGLFQHAGR